MACRAMEPGSAFGKNWGHNPSSSMQEAEAEAEDPKPAPQFASRQFSSTDSSTFISLQRFPSFMPDRTPVLHHRVIKLRKEEDHQLAGYVLEGMDPPRSDHIRPQLGHIPSYSKEVSLNCLSRPSPLGMRSVTCGNI